MKVKAITKLVEADGWFIVRTKGSHNHYKHLTKKGVVTIAGHPNEELKPKTEASILRQAGLK